MAPDKYTRNTLNNPTCLKSVFVQTLVPAASTEEQVGILPHSVNKIDFFFLSQQSFLQLARAQGTIVTSKQQKVHILSLSLSIRFFTKREQSQFNITRTK
jgi:hypothetical protein